MTLTATPELCPNCQVSLVTEADETPWCERCEWNLDFVKPMPFAIWPWSTFARLDRRIGYRADSRLIAKFGVETDGRPHGRYSEWFLRVVSLLLMLLIATLAVAGIWLMTVNWFFLPAVVGGVILLGIAYLLRPRFGNTRRAAAGAYLLDESEHPAFFGLLRKVAEAAGTRMPDHVLVDFSMNAMTAVLGWRRQRVLRMGVPLWIALRQQERVALLAHEFGHFANEDSQRGLLTQPALTTFGALSKALWPTRRLEDSNAPLALAAWKMTVGVVSWMLWMIHVGLNVMGAKQSRLYELTADRLAARVAGTAGAVSMTDVMATTDLFAPFFSASTKTGVAAESWRGNVESTREHLKDRMHRLRQLTMRNDASLFASHPAPGRRHMFLSRLPHQDPSVVLTEAESARIDAELAPFAEELLRQLKQDDL